MRRSEERAARKKRTRTVTLCGVLIALGVAVMYLGSFIEVLDLTVAVVASLFCIAAVIEVGGRWPFAIYAATAILSSLLLPNKFPAAVYLLFAGYYPMVKEKLEGRMRSRVICYAIKLLIFNVAFAAILAVSFFLLSLPFEGPLIFWATVALGNVTFVIYDIALTRLITVYLRMIRPRLTFLNKK